MSRRPTGKQRSNESRRQKARSQLGRIREHMQKGNIVLEVRDARAPRTTDPARLVEVPAGRVRCLVLTKCDLAEEAATRDWVRHLKAQGYLVLAADLTRTSQARSQLRELLKRAVAGARSTLGVGRAVIVGLPNVGKSTLINRVLGRSAMRTGDRPGVTKGESWCKIDEGLFLLDTPGVIEAMNRLVQEDEDSDVKLGLLRSAPASLLDPVTAACHLLGTWADRLECPGGLPPGPDPETRLGELALRWNHLIEGGRPDLHATATRILKEVAAGRWGRLTMEHPDDPLPEVTDPDAVSNREPGGGG